MKLKECDVYDDLELVVRFDNDRNISVQFKDSSTPIEVANKLREWATDIEREAHQLEARHARALKNCCEYCDNGDGNCIFPQYGVAPHTLMCDGVSVGSVLDDKETWPENFKADPDAPMQGTYTHCLECGCPNEANELASVSGSPYHPADAIEGIDKIFKREIIVPPRDEWPDRKEKK